MVNQPFVTLEEALHLIITIFASHWLGIDYKAHL
jgi:hypothetical protein